MALTFTQIVNKINTKINANGIKAITGSILNEVLLDMFGYDRGITKWQALTGSDFATTPASVSTITTTTDLTAVIKPGMAIRFRLTADTTYRYAVCSAITANLLTISGMTLTADYDISELYYSPLPGMVEMVAVVIPGKFAEEHSQSLILRKLNSRLRWDKSTAYCVLISHYVKTDDSGATQPQVNVYVTDMINEFLEPICSSNASKGLAVAEMWVNTTTDISTNYKVVNGQIIEIGVNAIGTNKDASDLTVQMLFIYE